MLSRKLAILLLLAVTTVGAFATLGDGKAKNTNPKKKSLLSIKTSSSVRPGSFSLTPRYNFRGSQVISAQVNKYINLNTSVTYQTGRTSYTVPLKKRVVLNDKIVFNPNAATRR